MGFTWTIVAMVVVMVIVGRFLSAYMVSVYENRTRWLSSLERPIYRIIGVDPETEQSWQRYGASGAGGFRRRRTPACLLSRLRRQDRLPQRSGGR